MKTRMRSVLPVLCLTGALALAGCGGSDDKEKPPVTVAAPPAAATPAPAAATPAPVATTPAPAPAPAKTTKSAQPPGGNPAPTTAAPAATTPAVAPAQTSSSAERASQEKQLRACLAKEGVKPPGSGASTTTPPNAKTLQALVKCIKVVAPQPPTATAAK